MPRDAAAAVESLAGPAGLGALRRGWTAGGVAPAVVQSSGAWGGRYIRGDGPGGWGGGGGGGGDEVEDGGRHGVELTLGAAVAGFVVLHTQSPGAQRGLADSRAGAAAGGWRQRAEGWQARGKHAGAPSILSPIPLTSKPYSTETQIPSF